MLTFLCTGKVLVHVFKIACTLANVVDAVEDGHALHAAKHYSHYHHNQILASQTAMILFK